jgi:simple sugar transport system permease protein
VRLLVRLQPVLAALGALAVAAGVLVAFGYPAEPALRALVSGSLGGADAWVATLLKTGPLLLAGLAVALSFRCGVWNIGAEGQLYAGALAATWVATRALPEAPGLLLVPLVVVAAAAGGAVFGALAGGLRAARGVNEVISTLMLNFVAIQLVALAVHGPLQELAGAYPQSDALPAAARLPAWGRLHAGVAAAFVAALACQWLVFRTPTGFRLRAVGLSPRAARFAGISPERYGVLALALAGGLAGLAGGFEVAGVTGRLYEGLSPGHGYTAIAVALLARLHPLGVIPAALFFGALEAGAGAMQRQAGVPSVATEIVKGVVVLLSVGFAVATGAAAPDAEPDAEDGADAAPEPA